MKRVCCGLCCVFSGKTSAKEVFLFTWLKYLSIRRRDEVIMWNKILNAESLKGDM